MNHFSETYSSDSKTFNAEVYAASPILPEGKVISGVLTANQEMPKPDQRNENWQAEYHDEHLRNADKVYRWLTSVLPQGTTDCLLGLLMQDKATLFAGSPLSYSQPIPRDAVHARVQQLRSDLFSCTEALLDDRRAADGRDCADKLATAGQAISQLESENTQLTEREIELLTDVSEGLTQIAELNRENATLKGQVSRLTAENESLLETIADMISAYARSKNKHEGRAPAAPGDREYFMADDQTGADSTEQIIDDYQVLKVGKQ